MCSHWHINFNLSLLRPNRVTDHVLPIQSTTDLARCSCNASSSYLLNLVWCYMLHHENSWWLLMNLWPHRLTQADDQKVCRWQQSVFQQDYRKNYLSDFHQPWWEGAADAKEKNIQLQYRNYFSLRNEILFKFLLEFNKPYTTNICCGWIKLQITDFSISTQRGQDIRMCYGVH